MKRNFFVTILFLFALVANAAIPTRLGDTEVLGYLKPGSTGFDLGSSTQKWDGFFNSIYVGGLSGGALYLDAGKSVASVSAIDATELGYLDNASSNLQAQLDSLSGGISAHITNPTGAHSASAITNVPSGDLGASTVQLALDELQGDIDASEAAIAAHIGDTSDAHTASAITNVPAGNLGASTVQAALDEIQSENDAQATSITAAQNAADDAQADIDAHLIDATAAHAASAISVSPSGALASTDAQAALVELQGDITTLNGRNINTTSPLAGGGNLGADLTLSMPAGSSTQNGYLSTSAQGIAGEKTLEDPLGLKHVATPSNPSAGYMKVYCKSDDKCYKLTSAGTETELGAGGGGGGGESTTKAIAQTGHGLSVGNVIRHNGTNYVTAQADSEANAEVYGVVSAVADANNFTITMEGYISGLSGLTGGSTFFLSPSSAGALTSTATTTSGQVSKPVLNAISSSAGYVIHSRGMVIGAAAASGPISARVSGSPGSVSAGNTPNYPTEDYDPSNIYSAGVFTFPAGKTHCQLRYFWTGDGTNTRGHCYKNGSDQNRASDNDTNGPGQQGGICFFDGVAGNTFNVRPVNNSMTGNAADNAHAVCF